MESIGKDRKPRDPKGKSRRMEISISTDVWVEFEPLTDEKLNIVAGAIVASLGAANTRGDSTQIFEAAMNTVGLNNPWMPVILQYRMAYGEDDWLDLSMAFAAAVHMMTEAFRRYDLPFGEEWVKPYLVPVSLEAIRLMGKPHLLLDAMNHDAKSVPVDLLTEVVRTAVDKDRVAILSAFDLNQSARAMAESGVKGASPIIVCRFRHKFSPLTRIRLASTYTGRPSTTLSRVDDCAIEDEPAVMTDGGPIPVEDHDGPYGPDMPLEGQVMEAITILGGVEREVGDKDCKMAIQVAIEAAQDAIRRLKEMTK